MSHLRLCIVIALASACSADARAPEACNPFGAMPEPVALDDVLAVGRDSDGALYVVDVSNREARAFSGSAMSLIRNRVVGSFESFSGGVHSHGVTVEVLPRPYVLIIEQDGDETRMARTFMLDRTATIATLPQSEVLDVIDVEAIENAELRNLPGDVTTEYFARAPSGELLLVVRPVDFESYEDFRLFYGEPDALFERELLSVTRARDGGSTTLVFVLDGAEVAASFPIEHDGTQFVPGDASLEQAGEVVPLERLASADEPELLGDATFQCLD